MPRSESDWSGCGSRRPTVSRRGWRGRSGVPWSSKHRALCRRCPRSSLARAHVSSSSLHRRAGLALSAALCVLIGLLFSTARRRNGFAGRARSRQRDAGRAASRARRPIGPGCAPRSRACRRHECRTGTGRTTSCGRWAPPTLASSWSGSTPACAATSGFTRSRRAPPPSRRSSAISAGPARLRWLSGRRSTSEAWDAYEALDGVPLATLLDAPRPWRTVRPWLLDLAREIDAGLKDGSIAALTIDHVWITRDGYAKLLDFRAPGVPPAANQEGAATLESGQTFLAFVARRALDGSSVTSRARPPRCSRSAAALRIGHARDAGAPRVYHLVGGGHPDGRSAAGPRPRGARAPRRAARPLRCGAHDDGADRSW